MPTDNIISRSDAAALIPEEASKDIFEHVPQASAVRSLFTEVPMSRKQLRVPVLSALPVAYFVNGDTGLKQTTEANWKNKYVNAEPIACIVPIPEDVLDDADYDIWGKVTPLIGEAIGRALDAAAFFSVNAPATFPTGIAAAAAAAGNSVSEAATAAQGGIFGDLDNALEALEDDGYDASGVVASRKLRSKLRKARGTTGDRVDRDRVSAKLDEFDGDPIIYSMRGQFPSAGAAGTNVRAFVGDWSQFAVGIRSDVQYKILDQAVITNEAGEIIYNLPQQDMVAMRCVFRAGWQVANIVNHDQPDEANRYPAATLKY